MKNKYVLFLLFSFSLYLHASTATQNDQRYAIIRSLLDQYKRPFSTLEIGASQGSYSLRIAHNYTAVCVIIEPNNQFLEVCNAHSHLNNLIFLNQAFTPTELQHLGECEDFDVVLALNIKNKFDYQWQDTIDALLGMGCHIIIETLSQQNDLEDYILGKSAQLLGNVLDSTAQTVSTIYLIETNSKLLQRKTWLRRCIKNSLYRIESSFTQKKLYKPLESPKGALQVQSWIPGINLCTFKMCHGIYPTKEMLKLQLQEIKNSNHSDWMANNMIIQGNKLVLIDGDDTSSKCFYSNALLQAHQDLIDLDTPAKIEYYFWHTLVNISLSSRQVLKFFGELFPPCPVIFDINPHRYTLIDKYLGYGAKVFCCDPHIEIVNSLEETSKREAIFITEGKLVQQAMGTENTLDGMIALYGLPDFCNIHCKGGGVYDTLKTLSRRIPCISHRFDIRYPEDLTLCLNHLASLGFTKFNFSVRDFPNFVLKNCQYTDSHKQWVHSIHELLQEIAAFAELDHQREQLWGYIYARFDNLYS